MRVCFLLGPAGSGKTFRCLTELREQLSREPDGPPLVLVAPKQATYELERQLLADTAIQAYTRLRILSFERLAGFVFEELGVAAPDLLSEEGRVMVLRALLARKRKGLRLFRASARLTGFAQQLSSTIAEFQQSRLAPEQLRELAGKMGSGTLGLKLQDLAELLQEYLDWLARHELHDRERLLSSVTDALNARPGPGAVALRFVLYVDGFAEFSESEVELLAALLPLCEQATLTFCLPGLVSNRESWLSDWSVTRKALEYCRKRLASVPGADVSLEFLARDPNRSRFSKSRVLRHLERHWAGESASADFASAEAATCEVPEPGSSLRLVQCADAEAEVILAAREILRFVKNGGRYRQAAVLVRDLEAYHQLFQWVFSRYEIPFFLDRRQSVAHHPLAELTRSALRTVALGWHHEDWFAGLKTGLVPAAEHEIDRLENEALARGWEGTVWQTRLRILEAGRNDQEKEQLQRLETDLENLRQRLIPPFLRLALALKQAHNRPSGRHLVRAIRNLWADLRVRQQLEEWCALSSAGPGAPETGALPETVWGEINGWLQNLELAFAEDPLPVREWLPIVEAGLANLTVGLIPPALDQVLIGTVDRSRNPDILLGLVLGLNETVFPAVPATTVLLTPADREELERQGVSLGLSARQQLSRERYYAYLACTRPREQLLLTCAANDSEGAVLNPSPFLRGICQIFPGLEMELAPPRWELAECEHPHELFGALLPGAAAVSRFIESELLDEPAESSTSSFLSPLSIKGAPDCRDEDEQEGAHRTGLWSRLTGETKLPVLAALRHRLTALREPPAEDRLSAKLAAQLYGPVLHTSVSRMEQFAACSFKFFVHSGLRAEERKRFELDAREQGSFQHDVLALFHRQLQADRKRWRDLTPAEARARVAEAAATLIAGYREGLLQASERSRFMARAMTESLQDFVEVLVSWMREQYRFDPVAVELPFGDNEAQPAWTLDLGEGHQLQLYGRIDRVDIFRAPGAAEALCVVVDYKSSQKQLDPLLLANGLQLQLLTYLNVLRDWPNADRSFGTARLVPAGVFYVNLRGKYSSAKNRVDALDEPGEARKLAYRHFGRFDLEALPFLDSRTGPRKGDQFNFRVLENGRLQKKCRDPLPPAEFIRLLDLIKSRLVEMGREVYSGVAALSPYRKGSATACDQCGYQSICRIDPWTHRFRGLSENPPRSVSS